MLAERPEKGRKEQILIFMQNDHMQAPETIASQHWNVFSYAHAACSSSPHL